VPVSATALTAGGHTGDQTSYNTNSISPGGNRLVLAWVFSAQTSGNTAPTLTGNGLTWVSVASANPTANDRLTLFRAMGVSPSSGAVTIDFGGVTQLRCLWCIADFAPVNQSGTNGSGAIIQSATNTVSGTSITVTLGAFGSADNATAAGLIAENNDAFLNQGSGFSQIGQVTQIESNGMLGEFKDTNDTSADFSWTTSSAAGAIAVEIKATGGPIPRPVLAPYVSY
jgi:hypothetical protein